MSADDDEILHFVQNDIMSADDDGILHFVQNDKEMNKMPKYVD